MDDVTMLSWLDRGRTLSYLLVAVGVVGEFLVDRISSPLIKRRDAAQQAEIARFNREAEEARQASSGAMERIAEAQKETARVSAAAAAANERAARLEKEAAELKKQAEEEHLARVKIEERLAPRTVSPAQAAKLMSDLSALRGKTVKIQFITGNPEIVGFVDSLEKPLAQVGLSVTKTPIMILGNVQPGITLQIGVNRMAEAEILANALVNAELAPRPVPAEQLTDPARVNDLIILVGPK
jgi:hypothetical protein